MSLFSYQNLKKILFKLDPETAHTLAGFGLRTASHFPIILRMMKNKHFVTAPIIQQEIFGCTFQNPVGLGAGFDKDGQYITAMPTLGFGFTEIGTVTPKPQDGNAKPRLFRLIEDSSIQNAMGFNNKGKEFMLRQLNNLYFL